MRDIWEQIRYTISTYVIKKHWFKVFVVFMILLIGFVIYKAYVSPDVKKGEVGNPSVWEDYDEIVKSFKNDEDADEAVPNASSDIESTEIETLINQFFFTANVGERDLFTSTLSAEQASSDFMSFDFSERFSKFDEAMARISRNGEITRVDIVRSLWVLESDASRIVLDLYYNDLEQPVRVSVIVKILEQYAFNEVEGETIKLPFVDSSVWDLIDLIEGQVDTNAGN